MIANLQINVRFSNSEFRKYFIALILLLNSNTQQLNYPITPDPSAIPKLFAWIRRAKFLVSNPILFRPMYCQQRLR